MSDKKFKITVKQLEDIWERHSYVVDPDGYRRMTVTAFVQAIQELGIKIVEE